MPVINSRYCLDDFSIRITSGVSCGLTVDSNSKQLVYDANELVYEGENPLGQQITAVNIPFTYKVGAPEKTDFASIYTKTRTDGTSGTPPDLSSRSFDPISPDLTKAANAVQNAIFTVGLPQYTQDQVDDELAGGTDNYAISVIIRDVTYLGSGWSDQNFQTV